MRDFSKISKEKTILWTFIIGVILLILSCGISVINRDSAFAFEMMPIPLLIALIPAAIISVLLCFIYVGCKIFKTGIKAYIVFSIIYILCMSIIGWWSATQAIF